MALDHSSVFLSEQEILIRDSARRVAQGVLAPTAAERDRTGVWPARELEALADAGLLGILIPEAYGGSGSSFVEYCLAIEAIAEADAGVATILHVHNATGHTLCRLSNEEQRQRWLPAIARGETIVASLFSEPQAGSETAAFSTTAVRDGDHYILNGTKQWISNGDEAGIGIVLAKTDAAAGKHGFTLFALDPRAPGYKVLRIEHKLGQRTAHTAQIGLENLRVPVSWRLGEEGAGYAKVLGFLSEGRITIAALAVGVAQAALDAAVRYAKEREVRGQPIFNLQAVNFDLAEMAMKVDVARQYMLHAARLQAAGMPCGKEASIAKLYASEMAEQVCSDAIQIHGGYGYVNDFPVERYYRDVRVTKIYEGTSHIQKLIIGRHL